MVSDFKKSCRDYHIQLKECCAANEAVVGPSVIRIYFKLARGQGLAALNNHLEDISREMKRSGVLIQQIQNSDKLILDVPRLSREMVSFAEVIKKLPVVDSPEKLYFPLGRTPEGKDIIKDISDCLICLWVVVPVLAKQYSFHYACSFVENTSYCG